MDITLTVRQRKQRLDNVALAVARSPDNLIESGLSELVDIIRRSMKLPKSGRMYGPHRASAPGEPPAIWSGELFASISKERTGPTSGRVYTGAPQAKWNEYGTHKKKGGGMRPRPFMRPAARKMRSRWAALSAKQLAVVIHRAARG